MKYAYLTILFSICCNILFSQELSDIEKKYDFVEVWGLKNQSKKDFLTEIMSYPEGICQQSLVKMGIKEGNKIPIAFSNKILITLRDIPKYTSKGKIFMISENKLNQWKEFRGKFNKLGFYERQQISAFKNLSLTKNLSVIDSLFKSLDAEYKSYGINLDKAKIKESLIVYKRYVNQFSKQDVLSALYNADVTDSIQESAIFLAGNYLKNKNDLLDFLPLLLKKNSGVQPLITVFCNNYSGNINWNKNIELISKLVNNPNPFQSLLVLKILDKTGFSKESMKSLLSYEMQTMKDILKSKFLPKEQIYFLITFLNKYSDFPIETDRKALLKKIN
ncbi:hypothetical protein [Polaribacter porphyrae]|uniref:Uncharacterized protein n=1 Tax=Polaribacter porphyrae TaxID=1137780 RepID=A0A2S7WQC9_9FLAO|nr:hypothetical protein [Polaribacter porphyrae]PQJ79825.1 hypothetical protein BTO18_11845 [Polaribacter porphyrae]